jgi:cyclase
MLSARRAMKFSVFAVSLALVGVAALHTNRATAQPPPTNNSDIEVLEVRPNVFMIAGAGGNITVQVGALGAVLVDTGAQAYSDRVLAEVRKLSKLPVRFIINTGADADHIGGNGKLALAGLSLIPAGGGIGAVGAAVANGGGAGILATESVLGRMSAPTGQQSPYPTAAWPSDTYSENEKDLYLNGEAVQVFYRRAAHSDGDSIVLFRRSDVVSAGDVLNMNRFPVIDLENGGGIQGEIDALNHIIELTVPELPMVWQEGGTLVIPGHGRICDEADIVEYRDMITIIRDVVASMMKKGMTLAQIHAADPALEYRPRFGADPAVTKAFVESVYKSLAKEKK